MENTQNKYSKAQSVSFAWWAASCQFHRVWMSHQRHSTQGCVSHSGCSRVMYGWIVHMTTDAHLIQSCFWWAMLYCCWCSPMSCNRACGSRTYIRLTLFFNDRLMPLPTSLLTTHKFANCPVSLISDIMILLHSLQVHEQGEPWLSWNPHFEHWLVRLFATQLPTQSLMLVLTFGYEASGPIVDTRVFYPQAPSYQSRSL